MKLNCLHGYFIFNETKMAQVSDFMNYTGLPLVSKDDYFTFQGKDSVPEFSLKDAPFMGVIATKNFEGPPWELYEENGFVFNFLTGLMQPITSITQVCQIKAAGDYFVSNGLILPGSVTADGSRVKDYSAWYSRDSQNWRYSEIVYV